MRPQTLAAIVSFAAITLVSISTRAYPIGPPPGVTGGFGEDTCVKCHNSFELNAGRAQHLGDVVVSGLPKQYRPGESYAVSVALTHSQDSGVWGFQFAARVREDGAQAGQLKPIDAHTQVASDKGVQYMEHTADGTFFNSFGFTWVAPANVSGDVIIHVAGNAANGDASPGGDYIYSTSITIPVASHEGAAP